MNRIRVQLAALACLSLALAGCAGAKPHREPAPAARPGVAAAHQPAPLRAAPEPPESSAAASATAGASRAVRSVHKPGPLEQPAPPTRPTPQPPQIASVSFEQGDQGFAPPAPLAEELPAPPGVIAAAAPLTLEEVVQSVQQSYPLLSAAQREYDIAAGKALAAWGNYDLNVQAYGLAQPMGFYQNYRNGVALSQPLWRGGSVYGGYRIGDGNFPVWYGERETDEGGEFKLGLAAPLLQGRAIDKQRAEVRQSDLAREASLPAIQSQVIEYLRVASQSYWTWLASGLVLERQRELLRLAEERVAQIEERVRVGDLERIALITNQQIIASREAKVIEAERKLQAAAIKLSLFLRTPAGQPVTPTGARLPEDFPTYPLIDAQRLQEDIAAALASRPELRELDLLSEQTRVELAQAENMLLPKVEARLEGSKDVGAPTSEKRDKTPFELEAGLYGEIPLQRREAQGKIRAAQGKLAQLTAKRAYTADKIVADVQDAYSALIAAGERTERARQNLNLARQSLELGRIAFEAGDIDVLMLNLYEQAVADAAFSLIAAQADFFFAQADYRAALALNP